MSIGPLPRAGGSTDGSGRSQPMQHSPPQGPDTYRSFTSSRNTLGVSDRSIGSETFSDISGSGSVGLQQIRHTCNETTLSDNTGDATKGILKNVLQSLYQGHAFEISDYSKISTDKILVHCTKTGPRSENPRHKAYIINLDSSTLTRYGAWWPNRRPITLDLRELLSNSDPHFLALQRFCSTIQNQFGNVQTEMEKIGRKPTFNPERLLDALHKIRRLNSNEVSREMKKRGISESNGMIQFTRKKTSDGHLCNDHVVFFTTNNAKAAILMDGAGSLTDKSTALKIKQAFNQNGSGLLARMTDLLSENKVMESKGLLDSFLSKALQNTTESTTFNMVIKLNDGIHNFYLGDTDYAQYNSTKQTISHDPTANDLSYWFNSGGFNSADHPPGGSPPQLHHSYYPFSSGDIGVLMTDGISKCLWDTFVIHNRFRGSEFKPSPGNSTDFKKLKDLTEIYKRDAKKLALAMHALNLSICPGIFPTDDSTLVLIT